MDRSETDRVGAEVLQWPQCVSAGRRLRSAKACLLRQRACRNADGGLRTQSARFLSRRHSGVSRLEKSSWRHDEIRGRNRALLTTQRTTHYWRRGVVAAVHHPCASPCARHEDRAQDDAYAGCRQPTTQPTGLHTIWSPEGAADHAACFRLRFAPCDVFGRRKSPGPNRPGAWGPPTRASTAVTTPRRGAQSQLRPGLARLLDGSGFCASCSILPSLGNCHR